MLTRPPADAGSNERGFGRDVIPICAWPAVQASPESPTHLAFRLEPAPRIDATAPAPVMVGPPSCTPSEASTTRACPADKKGAITVNRRHVCDGSNDGAGNDVLVKRDISGCQGHSPLVVDLDLDGLTVLDLATSRARFDLLNTGVPVHTAWVGPREALLTLDRNGDGRVNDRSELFGDMRGATDGFEDLRTHDDNADGAIDAQDRVYADLRLWLDAAGDGASQSGELFTLADKRAVSFDLRAVSLGTDFTIGGQRVSARSTFTLASGQAGQIDDIWFKCER